MVVTERALCILYTETIYSIYTHKYVQCALPVTTIMALHYLVSLGTRSTVPYIRIYPTARNATIQYLLVKSTGLTGFTGLTFVNGALP